MLNKILASKYFFIGFVALGCVLQLLVYEEGMMLSLISGLCGVISLVLVSRRNLLGFIFGFAQLGTYLVISWNERLWGEVGTTLFYIVTMACALFIWSKHREGNIVESRSLGTKLGAVVALVTLAAIIGGWKLLGLTNDSQPFMDSFSTVPAITAQTRMMLRYREQWAYWIVIDVASVVMWSIAGDYNMVAQFVFWTLNCVYGWILWKE